MKESAACESLVEMGEFGMEELELFPPGEVTSAFLHWIFSGSVESSAEPFVVVPHQCVLCFGCSFLPRHLERCSLQRLLAWAQCFCGGLWLVFEYPSLCQGR